MSLIDGMYFENLDKLENSRKNWTNADRIRIMSDEELAKAFVAIAAQKRPSTYTAEGFCLDDGEVSETDWLGWLKAPASKEEQT